VTGGTELNTAEKSAIMGCNDMRVYGDIGNEEMDDGEEGGEESRLHVAASCWLILL